MQKLCFLLLLAVAVCGQALKLSPVSGSAGSEAPITLTLTSTPGKEPVSLQWEISYSSPQLGIQDGDLVIGAVAEKAGKALTCQGRPQDAGTYVYRCVLVGGPERLSNGSVAVLSFRVRATARPGPTTVRLSNVLGVSAEGKPITIDSSRADVVIR